MIACDPRETITFKHKRDLPAAILAALKMEMAEAGEPYQAMDALALGESLPFRRFIFAQPG